MLFSNRSAAYAALRRFEEALQDALQCIKLKPDWPKGYARQGHALFHLERWSEAKDAYRCGLQKDPTAQFLKEGLQEIEKAEMQASARRRRGVRGYLSRVLNPLGLGTAAYSLGVVCLLAAVLVARMPSGAFGAEGGEQELSEARPAAM